jgi:hypothetical protein
MPLLINNSFSSLSQSTFRPLSTLTRACSTARCRSARALGLSPKRLMIAGTASRVRRTVCCAEDGGLGSGFVLALELELGLECELPFSEDDDCGA